MIGRRRHCEIGSASRPCFTSAHLAVWLFRQWLFSRMTRAPSKVRRGCAHKLIPGTRHARMARTMKKTKRAEALDAYMSPFSAMDRTESPATIR